MILEEKIKGVKSYSEYEYYNFISTRNEALFSLNENKIKAYFEQYDIPIPDNPCLFWGSVAQSILQLAEIESNDVPPKVIKEANTILDELNMRLKK